MRRRTPATRSSRLKITRIALPVIIFAVLAWSAEPQRKPEADNEAGLDGLIRLLQNHAFLDADTAATALLARQPENPDLLAVCGLARLKMGRIREAETIFRAVVQKSSSDPEAHLGLGRIARIRNHTEEAVAHLRFAVESTPFYEEALRQLWKTTLEGGDVSALFKIYELAQRNDREKGQPLPSWLANGYEYIRDFPGDHFYKREGDFEHLSVPVVLLEGTRNRMIFLRLNEKGEYPFHIDSASPDFITISPLLADDLGLQPTGSSSAVGVGTQEARVRFSILDSVAIGDIVFRNVPTMVSDLHTFRGRKCGLIGTGFLKRFNCTIDVAAGTMDLYPVDRPDLLRNRIDPAAVAADIPLYLFDQTTVPASVGDSPESLFILDSAAATNLVDTVFFQGHLEESVPPELIESAGISGAQGAQRTRRISGLSIRLGSLLFDGQVAHEFPMSSLNFISGRYAAGLIGNPLLWPYRVHLDFHNPRLILEKYSE